jgi:hypothetical protein
MGNKDWYPGKKEELPEWYQNFIAQLLLLQAKYGITNDQRVVIQADNDWIQYWVAAMHEIDEQVDALVGEDGYFNVILKKPVGTPAPSPVVIALPGGIPAEVPPGARARARDIANFIKGNPVYIVTDGELLGIVTTGGEARDPAGLTADFSVKTLAAFAIEVTFKKQGMDAMRFEMRHKGGEWTFVTVLTSSPGSFTITPATPGTAEQIELRSILMEKNVPVGNYSDIKPALIAP